MTDLVENSPMLEKLGAITVENDPRIKEHREKIFEFQRNIPVDIFGLCKALETGVVISVEVRGDLPRNISGLILKEEDKCHIFCNGNEPEVRQRFTLAHELAHYLLHWDMLEEKYPENFLLRGGLPNKQEIEANQLAADILMPYPKIDEYFLLKKNVSMSEMAKDFGVSKQALAVRLGVPLA